ncbi:MAG: ADP-forming succinate--CoA ligase subunit beta [Chloroflexi bacterium]|nr:ADP-forming succinate--CoA ligase subunit beta [Chloroflexota bacterium]
MVIHEYQAKGLFKDEGIPTPAGYAAETPEEAKCAAEKLGGKVAVKAQVHAGGRGKAGGIKLAATPEDAEKAAEKILGMSIKGITVKKLWIEEALDIESEYYLGITLDRSNACHVLMASKKGGVDIEQVASDDPSAILKYPVHRHLGILNFQVQDLIYGLELSPVQSKGFTDIVLRLWKLYRDTDCTLAEINPLVWTKGGQWTAGDAKMNFDDSAIYRQPGIEKLIEIVEEDPLERVARREKLAYVHLGGDIGIIGNGAGLVMTTLDVVQKAGGRPANFLDIGGGANAQVVSNAVKLVLSDPEVRGLLINIFGGITRCDEVAKGIAENVRDVRIPVVIRLSGTRENEGRCIIAETSLIPASGMQEAAEKIVSLVKEGGS